MAEKKKKKKQQAPPQSFIDQAAIPMVFAGGLCLLVGLAMWAIKDKFGIPSIVFCGFGLALIGFAIYSKPEETKQVLKSRQMLMGTNTSVSMIALLGILVFVNYLGIRHHKRFDMTKMKQHTLSEQTVKILRGLKQPVEITAFYTERGMSKDFQQMQDLLADYKACSRKVKAEVVNPYLQRDRAEAMHVTSLGSTIVECGTKKETVSFANEQSLTSSILKVTRDMKKKVYFLSGHGEHSIDDFDQSSGYSGAKSALEKLNYEVSSLSLIRQQPTIPNDCKVLVIAGPKASLRTEEVKLVNEYLDGHGHGLIMLDPESPPMTDVIGKWGVSPEPGIVIERIAMLGYATAAPAIQRYEPHLITDPLRNMTSAFLLVRPLQADSSPPQGEPGGRPPSPNQVTPLIKSSDESVAGVKEASGKISIDPGKARKGPFVLAAAVTSGAPPPPQYPGAPPPPPDNTPKTRLVVVGDSDFAANRMIEDASLADGNLFTNIINWLAEEEDLVSIQPKEPYVNRINLTKEQIRKVMFTSIFLLPFCVLLAGGVVWWKRR